MAAEKTLCTRRAYASGWKYFQQWCSMAGRTALPATPETASDFLVWCINQGFRLGTVNVRLHSISHYHHAERLTSPINESVRQLLRLARRDRKEPPRGMAALTYSQLKAIVSKLNGDHPAQLRNRTMLILGFAAGWRRSEVVRLEIQDVRMVEKGMTLWQAYSKTDQIGRGRTVGIEPGKREVTCPVRAMNAWLGRRGDFPGRLFTQVTPGGVITHDPLHPGILYDLVKRGLLAIGQDPTGFGAHSLRAGMITAAAESGASEASIKLRTGHRNSDTLQRYIRPATAFSMNPLAGVL